MSKLIYQTIKTYREMLTGYDKRHGFFIPRLITNQMNSRLNEINNRLKQTTLNYLRNKQVNVKSQTEKIQLLNPSFQLKRGFSIVTDVKDNIVCSSSRLYLDDIINVQVVDGKFTTKVIEIKENDA